MSYSFKKNALIAAFALVAITNSALFAMEKNEISPSKKLKKSSRFYGNKKLNIKPKKNSRENLLRKLKKTQKNHGGTINPDIKKAQERRTKFKKTEKNNFSSANYHIQRAKEENTKNYYDIFKAIEQNEPYSIQLYMNQIGKNFDPNTILLDNDRRQDNLCRGPLHIALSEGATLNSQTIGALLGGDLIKAEYEKCWVFDDRKSFNVNLQDKNGYTPYDYLIKFHAENKKSQEYHTIKEILKLNGAYKKKTLEELAEWNKELEDLIEFNPMEQIISKKNNTPTKKRKSSITKNDENKSIEHVEGWENVFNILENKKNSTPQKKTKK